ncbi:putative Cysteine desulfurase [Blattamonas nauphoetae]|uniref:Cysteine desulfurase n=1 Tax=Blattamonas nauphoetae TaxID=2049346 RepID=A0ABQ9XBM7_9EUKA|nr:putative Cysteine desulfurase [Blattamonas nauphoetae]
MTRTTCSAKQESAASHQPKCLTTNSITSALPHLGLPLRCRKKRKVAMSTKQPSENKESGSSDSTQVTHNSFVFRWDERIMYPLLLISWQEKRRQTRQLHAFTFDPDKEPSSPFDTATTLKEFPAITHTLTNHPAVYLDNAATTPRSTTVLDRLRHFDKFQNGNVHRTVHHLSEEATREYEGARKSIARIVGVEKDRDVVFTSGTADSINTIINSFIIPTMRHWIESTDRSDFVIVLTELEHHANIVPWQMALNMTETDTSS